MFSLRHAAWYGVVVLLLFTATAGPTAQGKPAKSPYRHLLFIRCGGAKTDDLTLGTLGAKGLAERKLYGKNNLNVGLDLLGAFQGRLYALKIRDLLSVDLHTGKVTRVATGVEAHDTAAGRFFWIDGKGAIREYDMRQGKARRVTLGPIPQAYYVKLAASPDGERLALFVPTGMVEGPAQLTVVRTADGKTERVGEPVEYWDFGGDVSSSFSVRLPFLWTDAEHVAFVRNQGMSSTDGGTRGGTPRLMQANVVTGKVEEVSSLKALPEKSTVGIERLPAPTFIARTFDGRQRHVIDPKTGKLTEDDNIGGSFRVREVCRGDETTWQLYYGERLLAAALAQPRFSVSPDGKQVVWMKDWQLRHFDTDTGKTRTLAKGWFADTFLWLTDRDLAPASR